MLNAVYLAGGIHGLGDSDAKGWREEAKLLLSPGVMAIDPMSRDYRGIEDQNVEEIVRGDLADIDRSHLVIAYCPWPSWGTAMEIHYTASIGKPVVAIVPSGSVSPWLKYHSKVVVASVKDAVDWVKSQ